jgi:Cu(I)/Ag(I) efflux system membrane protein CusA/SilA
MWYFREGRERYPVNVRYQRVYRSDIDAIRRTLISTPSGAQIPIEQVATSIVVVTFAPPMADSIAISTSAALRP